ncbi:MAG: LuxR C-terminal-related transcriptional regulator, partial [Thiohalobacterales bacterium]
IWETTMTASESASLQLVDESDVINSKILIAARQDFAIDGVVSILESCEDSYLVSCVEPGKSCMHKLATIAPDILLIHTSVAPEPAGDFIKGILAEFPALRIMLFGNGMSDDYLYEAVSAGIHGYINERMNGEHLTRAIQTVERGEYWVERHIMKRFFAAGSINTSIETSIEDLGKRLSSREAQVLALIMQGLPTKDIAEQLFLSHQGVKAHLTNLFRKFQVKNRAQLILTALDEISPVNSLSGMVRDGLLLVCSPDGGRRP